MIMEDRSVLQRYGKFKKHVIEHGGRVQRVAVAADPWQASARDCLERAA
jgi:hypothetical protein